MTSMKKAYSQGLSGTGCEQIEERLRARSSKTDSTEARAPVLCGSWSRTPRRDASGVTIRSRETATKRVAFTSVSQRLSRTTSRPFAAAASREQIAANGLQEQVKLLGYRTDLEKLVPAMDVVVSCSKREGLPLNIVEAMLCKKPVVASINRGNAELMEDGKTGYLLEAEDIKGFADRIFYLFQNPKLAMRFGNAGYQKAQNYTVSEVSSRLQTIIYKELINNDRQKDNEL